MADESEHAKVAYRDNYQTPYPEKSHDEEGVAELCTCVGEFHRTGRHDGVESKCGRTRHYREKDNHCYTGPQGSNVEHRSVITESFFAHVGL